MTLQTFNCQRCGNCCRHAGEVRLTDAEAAALAAYLSMSVPAFAGQYTRLRDDRRGLALAERPDGACIFLQDAPVSCRIQLVKPKQCREFPFTWRYEDLERVCPAARH